MRTSSRPVQRRLPRAVREQQMLDAAVVVFSERGFHPASMDEIATRAGISKPMLYAYLGTKEELFVACLYREGTRLMEAIARVVDPGLAPDEQLWRGLKAFFTFVARNSDGWSVLYRQARTQEPFAAELALMRGRIVDVVAGLLAQVISAGGRQLAAPELTPMAYALVGAGESLADWVVDHGSEAPEVTASRLMNFVWLGAAELLRGNTWRRAAQRDAAQRDVAQRDGAR